jgi:hypothetical protein
VVEGSDATTAMETERDDSVVVPLLSEAPLDADGSNVGRASVLSSTINLYVLTPNSSSAIQPHPRGRRRVPRPLQAAVGCWGRWLC